MEYRSEVKDGILHIHISGNIIFEETADFSRYLDSLLTEEFSAAVLNFSGVTGITSSAIGAVIDFHQKLTAKVRTMRIEGMSEKAYSVFKYFKLDQLFPIER